ncbi:hypothetical protein BH11BAC6_BH11BAC6_07600 [soil metagenome]
MPGTDIPSNSFFDLIYFDKWVHAGLFGMLTVFFGYPFLKSPFPAFKVVCIAMFVSMYGIAMEYVQKDYTKSRNFDFFDMVADTLGAFIAVFFLIMLYKKISPCGNRGRNQN